MVNPKYFRVANPRLFSLEPGTATGNSSLKIHDDVFDLKSQEDRSTYLQCTTRERLEFAFTAEVVGADAPVALAVRQAAKEENDDESWADGGAAADVRIHTMCAVLPPGVARFHVRFPEKSAGGVVRLKLVVRRPPV